jgi:hypothetical protein
MKICCQVVERIRTKIAVGTVPLTPVGKDALHHRHQYESGQTDRDYDHLGFDAGVHGIQRRANRAGNARWNKRYREGRPCAIE